MGRRQGTPNDDWEVIRMLSVRYAGAARGRNWLLFVAAVLSIVVLSMVFGITRGKVREEELSIIRMNGTAASGVVENGDVSQYTRLKSMSYIERAGRCVAAGTAEAAERESDPAGAGDSVCAVRWVDADAWEELICPAYTKIHGSYPEKKQEIMLPKKVLETLGIADPQKGMEIQLRVSYGLFQSSDENFILSGWFVDHGVEKAPGYISETKLADWGICPDKEADLIFRQTDRIGWQEAEERLYEDLHMKGREQKITVSDTAACQAVTGIMGGYATAVFGTVLVLCGIFFLCHNILQISMAGDVRWLGLLNTVGATQKQLSKVYGSQIRRILIRGTVLGSALSAVLLCGVIPAVLCGEYAGKTGGAEGIRFFHPLILCLAVLFTDGIILAASAGVIRRTVKMSCAESVGYTGVPAERRREFGRRWTRKCSPARVICSLAWKNATGCRKRFVLTVCSIFLGLETFLWAVVIIAGSDYVHVIEQRPDFLIAGQFSAWGREQGYGEEYRVRDAGQDPMLTEGNGLHLLSDNAYDEFSPISGDVRKKLMEMDGVKEDESYIMEGAYLSAVISEKGIRPLGETSAEGVQEQGMVEGWYEDVVQILGEEEIDLLGKYVREKELPIDMDAFESGSGVLILHDHVLSRAQEKLARESVGEPIYFETMLSREERIRWNGMADAERTELEKQGGFRGRRSENFLLCGYLDNRADDFPKIRQTWHGSEGSPYFLISETGFAKIPTERKTLYMELAVEREKEAAVNAGIREIISEENQRRARMTGASYDKEAKESGIFCISKSELMSEAASYIRGNRMILGSISAVLLLAGLANYFNVTVTGFLSRKKERSVMESIGMTTRQKRALVIIEGVYYCLFAAGLLVSAGMAVLLPVRRYMEQKLSYFAFDWPVTEAVLLIAVLLFVNWTAAWIVCGEQKTRRNSGLHK